MTPKKEFLSRIASRLGRDEPISSPPQHEFRGAPDFWQKHRMDDQAERTRTFVEEVEKLGGKVSLFPTWEALQQGCGQLLRQLQPNHILTWEPSQFAKWGWESLLAEWKDHLLSPKADQHHHSIVADVGITTVDYGIADTGTIVLCTSQERMRKTSLFPAVHIAFLEAGQIKTTMGEVLQRLGQAEGLEQPSSIHFISGPSRSSDIENDLSIGVHGPAALYVLIKE